jgi:hypothetical protein
VSHVIRTHAFDKFRCWCRSGMNAREQTPSPVKSALFVNIMRRRKKEIISCAVPRISRRWEVGMWTGLGWPRIETGGVHL